MVDTSTFSPAHQGLSNARLRSRHPVRHLHHADGGGPESGRHARPAVRGRWLRPGHVPGSPVQLGFPGHMDADDLCRGGHDAHPHLAQRAEPRPAPARGAGEVCGQPRPAERWPVRAGPRQWCLLGRRRGHGWWPADHGRGGGRPRGSDGHHPRAVGHEHLVRACAWRAIGTRSGGPGAGPGRPTTSASGWVPTSRGCWASPAGWRMAGCPASPTSSRATWRAATASSTRPPIEAGRIRVPCGGCSTSAASCRPRAVACCRVRCRNGSTS